MPRRWILFAGLILIHTALLWTSPQAIAPLLAGTLYLPLMALHAVGLDVYDQAHSGSWAAPSTLGWSLLAVLWGTVWWAIAALLARLLTPRTS